MSLQLNFRIEDRAGVMVLISKGKDDHDNVRPASSAEVELWNALTRRFAAPVRESYIRVNEQDLVTVLMERDHLRRQNATQSQKIQELEAENKTLREKDADGQGQRSQPPETADAGGSSRGEPTT